MNKAPSPAREKGLSLKARRPLFRQGASSFLPGVRSGLLLCSTNLLDRLGQILPLLHMLVFMVDQAPFHVNPIPYQPDRFTITHARPVKNLCEVGRVRSDCPKQVLVFLRGNHPFTLALLRKHPDLGQFLERCAFLRLLFRSIDSPKVPAKVLLRGLKKQVDWSKRMKDAGKKAAVTRKRRLAGKKAAASRQRRMGT